MNQPMVDPMYFIDEWNRTNRMKIHLRPVTHDSNLYGVEARFVGNSFAMGETAFDVFRNRIFTTSKGLMQVMTGIDEFRSGVLYLAVLFCNHDYSPKIVTRTLDLIFNEIFPDLVK